MVRSTGNDAVILAAPNHGILVDIAPDAAPSTSLITFCLSPLDQLPSWTGGTSPTFVGVSISVNVTKPDGTSLTTFLVPVRITFKVPAGARLLPGQRFMIAYWNLTTGWHLIAATQVGDEVFALVDNLGTYVLVIVSQ